MKESSVVIYASHEQLHRPVARVAWKDDEQVVVYLRQSGHGGHLTLHGRGPDPILFTVSMNDKPGSVWDEMRVKIARHLGYAHPERHAGYVSQLEVTPLHNAAGVPLVGWLVRLDSASDKQKYTKHQRVALNSPWDPFRLRIYLGIGESPSYANEQRVATPLGDLCFRIEPLG